MFQGQAYRDREPQVTAVDVRLDSKSLWYEIEVGFGCDKDARKVLELVTVLFCITFQLDLKNPCV